MDANEIKINRKRRLGNTSISDFFKPKVCNTDGNNNASSSVVNNPPILFLKSRPFLDRGGGGGGGGTPTLSSKAGNISVTLIEILMSVKGRWG